MCVQYHPDVCKQRGDSDSCDMDFQRINVAYQMLMSNMREAEERLEYCASSTACPMKISTGTATTSTTRSRRTTTGSTCDDKIAA